MTNIKNAMKQMDLTSSHIGDIVKQFDGNLYTDWAQKNPIADIETIATELKIADLESLQNKKISLEKKAKGGNKEIKNQVEIISMIENKTPSPMKEFLN